MDSDQEFLESELHYIFSNFDKTIDLRIYDKLEKTRENVMNDGLHGNLFRQPLTRVIIKNNTVLMNDYLRDRLEFWRKIRDVRLEYFVEQCNNSLEWSRVNLQRTVKHAILHIWIADGYPKFLGNVFKSMPIFTFSRSNYDDEFSNIPLWPDATLHKMYVDDKYSRTTLSWDDFKNYTVANLYTGKKKKTIFFHGADTTRTTHNLRMLMYNYKKPIAGMNLKIMVDNNFESIHNWSRYEYLLDLPGHAPWSNRLNFLPLLGCKIIHVDTSNIQLKQDNDWNALSTCTKIPSNLEVEYRSYPYTTFINYWIKNNSYISVTFNHYSAVKVRDTQLRELMNRSVRKLNELAFMNLVSDIERSIENSTERSRENSIDPSVVQKRQLELTNSRIAHYVYSCIELSSKLNFV